ncbi:phospholipid-transporting ATPase ABCA3-like [Rhipicephalus microplus]|uniref:phospholipid-transporting ATPase ABCA3-like n=1 Tax=Rhipicephalus microplus TaxID=6941 RepID=UPI003F6CF8DE
MDHALNECGDIHPGIRVDISVYEALGDSENKHEKLYLFAIEARKAGWDIVGKPALNLDNVTILEMWKILLITTFTLAVSIAYLSNVLPWTTPRPKPLLFPIMPTYWFPPTLTVTGTEINENDNSARFEPLPKLDVVIECKKLVKVFDGTIALNNVNVATYRSQVTILLGHNGAGKTTLMSILAGMTKPNSGSVLVSGRDIRSTGVGCLGYCPQFDALFEDLTVSEHLAYFGGIKGLDSCIMPAIIKKRLNDVRLSDRANAFPKELSGGMKRRLSIALALLTSPEVRIFQFVSFCMLQKKESYSSTWKFDVFC